MNIAVIAIVFVPLINFSNSYSFSSLLLLVLLLTAVLNPLIYVRDPPVLLKPFTLVWTDLCLDQI